MTQQSVWLSRAQIELRLSVLTDAMQVLDLEEPSVGRSPSSLYQQALIRIARNQVQRAQGALVDARTQASTKRVPVDLDVLDVVGIFYSVGQRKLFKLAKERAQQGWRSIED